MIETPWPNLIIYSKTAGEIDPYAPANVELFRGEEAFEPEVQGWRRWSKPSPEPRLDEEFEKLLLASIKRDRAAIGRLIEGLADRVAASIKSAPLLISILRAGVPISALLSRSLARRFGEAVPIASISLFQGLGWDEDALDAALRDFSGREIWFVDGWASGGGVAQELKDSYARWAASGRADFTRGLGPRLAVLCDPRGVAHKSALRTDCFISSSCFTAPETLGFSRAFVSGQRGMFRVYEFPRSLLRPCYIEAWLCEDEQDVSSATITVADHKAFASPPVGWRLHVNEVTRALINRQPREVLLGYSQSKAEDRLAPVLHLCRLRRVPVHYNRAEVTSWGAIAAARMIDA